MIHSIKGDGENKSSGFMQMAKIKIKKIGNIFFVMHNFGSINNVVQNLQTYMIDFIDFLNYQKLENPDMFLTIKRAYYKRNKFVGGR